MLERRDGGNLVIVGSDRRLPESALQARLAELAPELGLVSDPVLLDEFVEDAQVLRDDFAPVDQLHTPYAGL